MTGQGTCVYHVGMDDVQVKTRLGWKEARALRRLASANQRSVSAELRVAIDRHLAVNKNGAK